MAANDWTRNLDRRSDVVRKYVGKVEHFLVAVAVYTILGGMLSVLVTDPTRA